jgi:hypothetical protein
MLRTCNKKFQKLWSFMDPQKTSILDLADVNRHDHSSTRTIGVRRKPIRRCGKSPGKQFGDNDTAGTKLSLQEL